MSEWQPIETMPKGVRECLIFQPAHKLDRYTLPPRICLSGDTGVVRQSTHWMPLPAFPSTQTEAAE